MYTRLFELELLTETNKEIICLLIRKAKIYRGLHEPAQLIKDQVLIGFKFLLFIGLFFTRYKAL